MAANLLRTAFLAAGKGRLRLASAGQTSDGRLKFTGWHHDGTPFAFVSSRFTGDPLDRAAQIAQDLITAHTGDHLMSAPPQITGLTDLIKGDFATTIARAGQAGEKLRAASDNLATVSAQVETLADDTNRATAALQAAIGGQTNGGQE